MAMILQEVAVGKYSISGRMVTFAPLRLTHQEHSAVRLPHRDVPGHGMHLLLTGAAIRVGKERRAHHLQGTIKSEGGCQGRCLIVCHKKRSYGSLSRVPSVPRGQDTLGSHGQITPRTATLPGYLLLKQLSERPRA